MNTYDGSPLVAQASAEEALQSENAVLRLQMAQLQEALRAIQGKEVDALYVADPNGGQLFTLAGADRAYRALIEEMGEGALTLTANGVVLYANQRFAAMLGQPLRDVIGSHIEVWFAPEGHEVLASLFANGQTKRGAELDLLDAAGMRVPTLLSVSGLAVDGLADGKSMIVTDLTMHRRSEAAAQARQTLLKVLDKQRETEERLRMVLDALPAQVALLDTRGVIVSVNDAWKDFGRENGMHSSDFGVGLSYLDVCDNAMDDPSGNAAGAAGHIRAVLGGAVRQAFMEYACHSSTEECWFRMSVTQLRGDVAKGAATGAVVMHVNVSDRKRAELAALSEQLLLTKVFEQSNEGLIIADEKFNIVKVNQAFTRISGYSETDALGQDPRILRSGRDDNFFYPTLWAQISDTGRWQGEVWNLRKSGAAYPQWLSIGRVLDDAGKPTNYIASFTDITERKAAEESILHLANYDTLTGLPNRVLMADRAMQALQMAHRASEPLALMFIDLDHFKIVNDTHGHRVGDLLLIAIAGRFKSVLRDQDTLSRMGGDEFVLLLPGTDADGAARVAAKLLQSVSHKLEIEQHELSITPSIGIALYPLDGADYDTLTKCADAAMYRAKGNGRNTFSFYTAEIEQKSARNSLVESELRLALERNQLELHYQPQQSLRTGKIVGVEALLRWQHPVLGWISPAEFIPIAEKCGQIVTIGNWVLETAVRQLKAWSTGGMAPVVMAVNLSAVQFREKGLPELVRQILDEAGVARQFLELELTESVALDDPIGAIEMMDQLHALGVSMSIDDFGTGYSSLSYLKRFKVNKLKIDQSFVRGLTEDRNDQAIVGAIIGLAGSMDMKTIAEGVETQQQMEYLRDKGCDEIQGYWFGRPMPAQQLQAFVLAHGAATSHPIEWDAAQNHPLMRLSVTGRTAAMTGATVEGRAG